MPGCIRCLSLCDFLDCVYTGYWSMQLRTLRLLQPFISHIMVIGVKNLESVKRVLYVILCTVLWLAGCSSGDDPAAVDCSQSDLQLTLISKTNPSDCIVPNGTIEVEATGGMPPYQYRLNAGSPGSSATFSGLGAGTYIVTVRDRQGCEKDLTVELEVNSGLTASVSSQTPNSQCLEPHDGSVTILAAGGSGNYQFAINGGAFGASQTFTRLKDGIHTITVKDLANNCTFSLSISIGRLPTGITYNAHIKPLFEAKCSGASCHPSNGELFTYAAAFSRRMDIKNRTQSGNMPRNGTLSSEEKALIACWVDDGAPEN